MEQGIVAVSKGRERTRYGKRTDGFYIFPGTQFIFGQPDQFFALIHGCRLKRLNRVLLMDPHLKIIYLKDYCNDFGLTPKSKRPYGNIYCARPR